jgi:uroporphyrin-III C-methyltransferase/precorrin-2 dehydrogenase/sirohydrochlorin ferrochelatase
VSGIVSFIGAGPGDPELLTLKAVDRLRRAEVVLYDALVTPGVLQHAPDAQQVFVGKRRRKKSLSQAEIETRLIAEAQAGRRVVRLKGGDPFVLGRGGEEALALAKAGVPFEIIPGISAAVAAPARAGIPVTHRGMASGVLVVTGHAEEAYGPILRETAPGKITLVVLMGLAERARIAGILLEAGWPPVTPAAVIRSASLPEEETWMGTLADLGGAPVEGEGPGTLVVGGVVSLASVLGPLLSG